MQKPITNTWMTDSKKPSKFITYFDMNNLYGWGSSEYLSYGGFKWLQNIDGFDMSQSVKRVQ